MPYFATVANDSPLGYWDFNEASGTLLNAGSGGQTGTLSGNAFKTQGIMGGGIETAATSGEVTLSTRIALTGSKTFIAWVNTKDTRAGGSWPADVGNAVVGDTATGAWDSFGVDSGRACFKRYNSAGGAVQTLTGATYIADGKWHLIAVVYNAVTVQATLYVDGKVDGVSSGWTHAVQGGVTSLGRSYGTSRFNGRFDEVEVYADIMAPERMAARWDDIDSVTSRNAALPSDYEKIVVRDSAKLFLPLGETIGTRALNILGESANYIGSPVLSVNGPNPNTVGGITLEGNPDYVRQLHSATLDVGTGEFTHECWLRGTYKGALVALLGRDHNATGNGQLVYITTDGYPRIFTGGTATTGTVDVMDGQPHHLVYCRRAGRHELWVDGVRNIDAAAAGSTNVTGELRIGVADGSSAGYWQGDISDYAYYDYALTSTQISQHVAARPLAHVSLGEAVLPKGCLLHLPLDDRGGTVAYATVGNNALYAGGPTLRVTGPSAKTPYGITVDGTDDRASVDYRALSNEYSYEIWARIDALPTSGAFWKHGNTTNVNAGGIALGVGTGAALETSGSILTGLYEGLRFVNTGVTLTTGWHHFVLTIQVSPSTARYYVDGRLVFTDTGATFAGPLGFLQVGGYTSTTPTDRFFGGGLSGFSWYNRVLTNAEVYERYALTAGLPHSNSPVRY